MAKEHKEVKTTQVTIKADVLERLKQRAHPDQAMNGVIQELLDKVDTFEKPITKTS